MRQILELEDHVPVPRMMHADPFYRIMYLIKEEIRRFKWLEAEKGQPLSWPEARAQWTKAYRKQYEEFLVKTLSFPDLTSATNSAEKAIAQTGARLSNLPHRAGG